jgi:trimethylamine---corrinoid protein Co-methyltransferase
MRSSHNFLAQKHTRQYLRAGEVLLTPLAERRSWDAWEQDGRQGMAERAQAEAERLLREHQVPPLSKQQESELDEILNADFRSL